MKSKLLGIVFILLGLMFAYAGFSSDAQHSTLGGLIVCAVLAFLGIRKLFASPAAKAPARATVPAAPRPQPAAKPAPASPYTFVSFHVAGVTFNNDDGTSRQWLLRKLYFQDPPFDTSPVEVRVNPTEYQGKPAYTVTVNGIQIGWVPSDKIAAVQEALEHDDVEISGFEVTGGGRGNNYGAVMGIRYKA